MRKLIPVLALLLAASTSLFAQTTIRNATVKASTIGSQTSRFGSIYVVFPPASTGADFATFRALGGPWDNSLIDGVTIQLNFNNLAQINSGSVGGKQYYVPSTTAAGLGNCTAYPNDGQNHDTDTCVRMTGVRAGSKFIPFAAPIYFPFDWTTIESTTSPGVNMWFQATPSGARKTVNFLDFSQSNGAVNGSTPSYVTVNTYVSQFNPARQDVLNALTSSNTCNNQYTGNPNISASRSGGTVATVTDTNHGLNTGDTVYVSTQAGSAQYTTGTGAVITVTSKDAFTYDTGSAATDSATITYVAASESFIVPYELPYITARQAFITAVHLHYVASYSNAQGGTAAQIGYWRNGQSAGGEVVMFCNTQMKALAAPYTLAADTATVPGVGDNCYTGAGCNTWGWVGYYQGDLFFEESLAPFMRQFNSINVGGTGGPSNFSIPQAEYPLSIVRTNGSGVFDGIGEQGASLFDITAYALNPSQSFTITNPPNICGNFGCGMVQNTYISGSPVEIQQISISAYDDFDCNTAAHGAGNKCGVPSQGNGGDSGDLRQWLQFYAGLPATDGTNTTTLTGHATVLELYYKDAGLALDPNFCVLNGPASTCTSSYTNIGGYNWYLYSTPTAYQFHAFQTVGLGAGCASVFAPAATPQGNATGDCSYAAALKLFHGRH